MILLTELAAAPILSKADPDVLALVSQSAADIRPGAGRWRADRDSYLLETSVAGIFTRGDVRASPVKRVAAAVAGGSMRSPSSTSSSTAHRVPPRNGAA